MPESIHPQHHLKEHGVGGISAKGLKAGKVGVIGGAVIGLSCIAPAYALTAALGPTAAEVGTHMPAILIVGFIPMLFVVFGYRELNTAMPDSGTSFTWATRAFGPYIGWMTGYGLVIACILVLANLAAIAVDFFFILLAQIFQNPDLAELTRNLAVNIPMTVLFVAIAAYISYRGVEATQMVQYVLVGVQLIALGWFVIAAIAGATGSAPVPTAIPFELDWFNPVSIGDFAVFSAGISLSIFLYWGWDVVITMNEEAKDPEKTPGRASMLTIVAIVIIYLTVSVAALMYAGVGADGIGLSNSDNADNVLAVLAPEVMGPAAVLMSVAILVSSAASLQSTMVSPSRTLLAMGHYQAVPRSFAKLSPRFKTPTMATIVSAVIATVFYIIMRIVSENALWDTIAALGLMVCFYYGITGLAAVWYFRNSWFASARNFFYRFLLPLLGGITLVVFFVKTAIDSLDPAFGSGTALFATSYDADGIATDGVGIVFVLSVGILLLGVVLMFIMRAKSPAFFRGEVLQQGTDADKPMEVLTD